MLCELAYADFSAHIVIDCPSHASDINQAAHRTVQELFVTQDIGNAHGHIRVACAQRDPLKVSHGVVAHHHLLCVLTWVKLPFLIDMSRDMVLWPHAKLAGLYLAHLAHTERRVIPQLPDIASHGDRR